MSKHSSLTLSSASNLLNHLGLSACEICSDTDCFFTAKTITQLSYLTIHLYSAWWSRIQTSAGGAKG